MDNFMKSAEESLREFGSDASKGLTPEQVEESRARWGRNAFTQAKKKSLLRRIWEACTEPMLILLFFAWLITVAVNIVNVATGNGHFDFYECIGILVAIILSVTLTVVMEGRSAKAFEELNKIKEGVEIKVVRGGVVQYVPQQDLVVGDIVYLETGNKVAADGRLLESLSLQSDESSLTGESAPVKKDANAVFSAAETPVAERTNMVYSGCFITGGTGRMVVTDVGDSTQFGLIAREIQKETEGRTPLQEKMGRLGKVITVIGGVCAALIFIIQLVHILVAFSAFPIAYMIDDPYLRLLGPFAFIFINAALGRRMGARLGGLLCYPLSMLLLAAAMNGGYISQASFVSGILAMGLGDGIAAIVGMKWGRIRLGGKTLEGSFAMLAAVFLVFLTIGGKSPSAALVAAIAATLAELLSPGGLDNVSVPVVSAILMEVL